MMMVVVAAAVVVEMMMVVLVLGCEGKMGGGEWGEGRGADNENKK